MRDTTLDLACSQSLPLMSITAVRVKGNYRVIARLAHQGSEGSSLDPHCIYKFSVRLFPDLNDGIELARRFNFFQRPFRPTYLLARISLSGVPADCLLLPHGGKGGARVDVRLVIN